MNTTPIVFVVARCTCRALFNQSDDVHTMLNFTSRCERHNDAPLYSCLLSARCVARRSVDCMRFIALQARASSSRVMSYAHFYKRACCCVFYVQYATTTRHSEDSLAGHARTITATAHFSVPISSARCALGSRLSWLMDYFHQQQQRQRQRPADRRVFASYGAAKVMRSGIPRTHKMHRPSISFCSV